MVLVDFGGGAGNDVAEAQARDVEQERGVKGLAHETIADQGDV